MAKVQSVNRKTSFLFVGDMHAHYEEWIGSSVTNFQDKSERDFVSSLVVSRWLRSEVLDLVLTDVPDIVGVPLDSPVGASVQSAIIIDVVVE